MAGFDGAGVRMLRELRSTLLAALLCPAVALAGADPFADLDARLGAPPVPAGTIPARARPQVTPESSALYAFFQDNFTFRKEIFSQLSDHDAKAGVADPFDGRTFSRQSIGFEALKKFSTETATVGAFDVQARLVHRDDFADVVNDIDGLHYGDGWSLEFHNAYADAYDALDGLMSPAARARNIGRFNVRVGRFYLPFGLNMQTDTHGTVLQLSNGRNFGFDRDWYAGLWGALTDSVNYDVYYMLGSGHSFDANSAGMLGARLSLSNRLRVEHGIEGGVAVISGERISPDAVFRSPSVLARAGPDQVVETRRVGADARYSFLVPTGSLTAAAEVSGGSDGPDDVFTQLYQLDYLSVRRKWGLAAQYRRFWQDLGSGTPFVAPEKTDASVFGEVTRFFKNDLSSSRLHWIKLNVEKRLERQDGRLGTIGTVQYYRYF